MECKLATKCRTKKFKHTSRSNNDGRQTTVANTGFITLLQLFSITIKFNLRMRHHELFKFDTISLLNRSKILNSKTKRETLNF